MTRRKRPNKKAEKSEGTIGCVGLLVLGTIGIFCSGLGVFKSPSPETKPTPTWTEQNQKIAEKNPGKTAQRNVSVSTIQGQNNAPLPRQVRFQQVPSRPMKPLPDNYIGRSSIPPWPGGAEQMGTPPVHQPRQDHGDSVSVHGYTRKDGTYVRPHTRSSPGSSHRR